MGPWSVRSRPVCCFTAATIRGFRLSGSKLARKTPAPTITSPTTTASDHRPMRTGRGIRRDAGRLAIALATLSSPPFGRSRRGRVKTQRAESLRYVGRQVRLHQQCSTGGMGQPERARVQVKIA